MSQIPPPHEHYAAETSGKAVASLVCSIVGFFTCPVILHVVGIILGNSALSDIRRSQGRLSGDGVAQAGVVLGWIGVGLAVVGFCITSAMALLLMSMSVVAMH